MLFVLHDVSGVLLQQLLTKQLLTSFHTKLHSNIYQFNICLQVGNSDSEQWYVFVISSNELSAAVLITIIQVNMWCECPVAAAATC